MSNKASFVNFSVWNACNLRCKYCYNDSWRDNKQFFEDVEVLKEKLLGYEFIWEKSINLLWWEPLQYPQIFELLDFLKDNNFTLTITTNWIKFADKKFFNSFLVYSDIIEKIVLSVNSDNLILEEKITWRKWTFDKTILSIENLLNNNFDVKFSLVINNYNLKILDRILNFYFKKYNKKLSIQGMLTYPYSSDKNIEVLPKYEDIINNFNSLWKDIYKIEFIHWIPLCIINKIDNVSCRIRELDKRYLKSQKRDWVNLFETNFKTNYIWDKCRKCFALWKFCFWPWKKYVEKYWYEEFKVLSKQDVYTMLKKQILLERKLQKRWNIKI